MVTSPLRIGLISLDHWYWAFSFAADVATCQHARLVALADDDIERGRQVAERFGVERITAEPLLRCHPLSTTCLSRPLFLQ